MFSGVVTEISLNILKFISYLKKQLRMAEHSNSGLLELFQLWTELEKKHKDQHWDKICCNCGNGINFNSLEKGGKLFWGICPLIGSTNLSSVLFPHECDRIISGLASRISNFESILLWRCIEKPCPRPNQKQVKKHCHFILEVLLTIIFFQLIIIRPRFS